MSAPDKSNGNGNHDPDTAPDTPRVDNSLLKAFHTANETMREALEVMSRISKVAEANKLGLAATRKAAEGNAAELALHRQELSRLVVLTGQLAEAQVELATEQAKTRKLLRQSIDAGADRHAEIIKLLRTPGGPLDTTYGVDKG